MTSLGRRAIALQLLLGASCTPEGPTKIVEGPQPDPILHGVAELSHPNAEVRDKGAKEIRNLIGQAPSQAQIRLLLHAAAQPWASPEAPATLMRLVAEAHPSEDSVAEIRAAFPNLGAEARAEALTLLLGIPGPLAATAFADLYPSLGPEMQVDLRVLRDAPRDAEIFFPALFARLGTDDWFEIVYTTLTYLEVGQLEARHLDPIRDRLLRDWRSIHARLLRAERKKGLAWVWEPDYQGSRNQGALLLDLFGYLEPDDVERALRQALKLKDPRILLFAGTSAVRLGLSAPPNVLGSVAAWAETRGILFDRLSALEAEDLMPIRFRSQAALAESDMVHWLAFPSELGRGPAQIELMLTGSDPSEPGGAWYLYRFRVEAPHPLAANGWMAGAAGPFFVDNLASAGTQTFSHFTSWDQASPEEHLASFQTRADDEEAEEEVDPEEDE